MKKGVVTFSRQSDGVMKECELSSWAKWHEQHQ